VRILLDTHAFLWLIVDDPRLSAAARRVFLARDNEVLLSLASMWEIAIKVSLGKLRVGNGARNTIEREVTRNGLSLLPITEEHIWRVAELPFFHRDPFDRLLATQALVEGLQVVSSDTSFDAYGVKRIW